MVKRILDYAQFDRIATNVEQRFHQASLVRAKTAITMMGRSMHLLREQIVRMIFLAWKGSNAVQRRHQALVHRLLSLREAQRHRTQQQRVLQLWRWYTAHIAEDRARRLALAAQQNERTKMRQCWSHWGKYLRMRAVEKLHDFKVQVDAERRVLFILLDVVLARCPNGFLLMSRKELPNAMNRVRKRNEASLSG